LNDEVINLKAEMINERLTVEEAQKTATTRGYMWSTHFYTKLFEDDTYNYKSVRRWTKRRKIDIFALDKVLVPVNLSNLHWVLAVIDMKQQSVTYMDPLLNDNNVCLEVSCSYLLFGLEWIATD
jgi:sentrin-specific protease 1